MKFVEISLILFDVCQNSAPAIAILVALVIGLWTLDENLITALTFQSKNHSITTVSWLVVVYVTAHTISACVKAARQHFERSNKAKNEKVKMKSQRDEVTFRAEMRKRMDTIETIQENQIHGFALNKKQRDEFKSMKTDIQESFKNDLEEKSGKIISALAQIESSIVAQTASIDENKAAIKSLVQETKKENNLRAFRESYHFSGISETASRLKRPLSATN